MQSREEFIGTVIDGKYRIERLLGRGAMGEVYAGTHTRLDRPIAIKILHPSLGVDDLFVARFSREARAAAKLEHPNAVNVYDFGSFDDGTAYLVMAFIEGVTLRDVIRREGRLPLDRALDLIRQAASAVAAAHARGIVHRDIKPDNMMVRTEESGALSLKVVDFGLAKIVESGTQITNQGDWLGTPKYMAPEQVSSDQVDGRADVYALGCVLFELLAGRAPFEGTSTEVAFKHALQPVPTFESLGVDVIPAVERAIRHALEKSPDARTQTATDFVRELDEARSPAEATNLGARPSGEATRVAAVPTADPLRTVPTHADGDETRVRVGQGAPARPAVARPTPQNRSPRRLDVRFPAPRETVARGTDRSRVALAAGVAAVLLLVAGGYFYVTSAAHGTTNAPSPNRSSDPSSVATSPQTNAAQHTPAVDSAAAAQPDAPAVSAPVVSVPSAPASAPTQTAAAPSTDHPADAPAPASTGASSRDTGGDNATPSLTGDNPRPQPQAGDPRDPRGAPPAGYPPPPPGYPPPPPPGAERPGPPDGPDRRPPGGM
jgi:serine/threonine-protein kinase